jgi:hypothetical protein
LFREIVIKEDNVLSVTELCRVYTGTLLAITTKTYEQELNIGWTLSDSQSKYSKIRMQSLKI